jgi:xylulokinase
MNPSTSLEPSSSHPTNLFLGIDLGTSSVKTLLLSSSGKVLNRTSRPYAVLSPYPGWAESNPLEWYSATVQAVRECVGDPALEVRAIGLSGQMHSVVLCDEGGNPLRDAVLWADGRSSFEVEVYRALTPELLRPLVNPLNVGMTGPTLLWLKKHEPEVYAGARYFLQAKDWLRLRLTGQVSTDPSDASGTLLYNLERNQWHTALIEALELDPGRFAPVLPSSAVSGFLTARAAQDLGLPSGLPVAGGAADTAAAILGSGLLEPGAVQLTVGTGAQIVTLKNEFPLEQSSNTHFYRSWNAKGGYQMAALQNAGLALEFARKTLGLSWEAAYAQAFSVPSSAGLTFLPYLSGERTPHGNPHLRGAWLGLALEHTPAHLMRSAFEGVAFALRDGLNALNLEPKVLRVAGGGTLEPRWRQLLSDVLGCSLQGVQVADASARGAALLGAMCYGLEIPLEQPTEQVAVPDAAQREALEEAYRRFGRFYARGLP